MSTQKFPEFRGTEKQIGYATQTGEREYTPEKIITRRPNGTKRVQTKIPGPSRTQKQFKDECNVNNIIKKYKATGTITHVRNRQEGVYADLTTLPDFQQAMDVIVKASNAFQEVPAEIRSRFNNDPQQFIDYLNDPKNIEESYKLGLREKPKVIPEDPTLTELKKLNQNLTPKPKAKKDDE